MAFLPDRKEYARASHVCIVTRVRHMRNPLLRRFISEAMDGQAAWFKTSSTRRGGGKEPEYAVQPGFG